MARYDTIKISTCPGRMRRSCINASCFQRRVASSKNLIGVRTGSVDGLFAGLLDCFHACLLTRSYPPLVKHVVGIHCIMHVLKKECIKFNAQHPVAFKQTKPCIIYRDT